MEDRKRRALELFAPPLMEPSLFAHPGPGGSSANQIGKPKRAPERRAFAAGTYLASG